MEEPALRALKEVGIPHLRVTFQPGGINPMREGIGLLQLVKHLRDFKPDLVHCVSPKGLVYGGIASRLCNAPALVLAVSGLGFAFTSSGEAGIRRRALGSLMRFLFHFAFSHPNAKVIVQNADDLSLIETRGLAARRAIDLIPGSGVPLSKYLPSPQNAKNKIVLFPARMLRDKGLVEFVEAARSLKGVVPEWRFLLAGAADYDNPTAIGRDDLETWTREGVVEWLGHVDNMIDQYAMASIVCLPSYREGMPKSLLEAAASACAVVTTDVPGCREAMTNEVTGLLVPARDSKALAAALLKLMSDGPLREAYGQAGRRLAEQRFSIESVVERTLNIYRELTEND